MVVTLGQQYNVGEKPTVILYTYIINRHAGTPDKKRKQNRNNVHQTKSKNRNRNSVYSTTSNMVVIMYCFIGRKDKASTWYIFKRVKKPSV